MEIATESSSVENGGIVQVGAYKLVKLHILHPGTPVDRTRRIADVYLDPEANFAIRRIDEYYYAAPNAPGNDPLIERVYEREVLEYRKFPNGVYFPTKSEMRIYEGPAKKQRSIIIAEVTNLRVNEPLSENALTFRFPEHVQVLDSRENPARRLVWGANDEAVRELRTLEDLEELGKTHPIRAVEHHPLSKVGSRRFYFLLVNLLAVVLVVVFLVYWRRHK
jgi:hypothetical protein